MVSPLTLAQLCKYVYLYASEDPKLPKKWEEYEVSTTYHFNNEGHFCIAFINHTEKCIVIAHRGTSSSKEGSPNLGDLAADVELGFFKRKPHAWLKHAEPFSRLIREKAKKLDYRLIETGHSLGGVYAALNVCFLGDQACTFDSPGIEELIKEDKSDGYLKDYFDGLDEINQLEQKIQEYNTELKNACEALRGHSLSNEIEFTQLTPTEGQDITPEVTAYFVLRANIEEIEKSIKDSKKNLEEALQKPAPFQITNYLAAPNLINTNNTHIGEMIRIFIPHVKTDIHLNDITDKISPFKDLIGGALDSIIQQQVQGILIGLCKAAFKWGDQACRIFTDYQFRQHSLHNIICSFSKITGEPYLALNMETWPSQQNLLRAIINYIYPLIENNLSVANLIRERLGRDSSLIPLNIKFESIVENIENYTRSTFIFPNPDNKDNEDNWHRLFGLYDQFYTYGDERQQMQRASEHRFPIFWIQEINYADLLTIEYLSTIQTLDFYSQIVVFTNQNKRRLNMQEFNTEAIYQLLQQLLHLPVLKPAHQLKALIFRNPEIIDDRIIRQCIELLDKTYLNILDLSFCLSDKKNSRWLYQQIKTKLRVDNKERLNFSDPSFTEKIENFVVTNFILDDNFFIGKIKNKTLADEVIYHTESAYGAGKKELLDNKPGFSNFYYNFYSRDFFRYIAGKSNSHANLLALYMRSNKTATAAFTFIAALSHLLIVPAACSYVEGLWRYYSQYQRDQVIKKLRAENDDAEKIEEQREDFVEDLAPFIQRVSHLRKENALRKIAYDSFMHFYENTHYKEAAFPKQPSPLHKQEPFTPEQIEASLNQRYNNKGIPANFKKIISSLNDTLTEARKQGILLAPILVFGNTRIGKSTLVNYILGTDYEIETRGLRQQAKPNGGKAEEAEVGHNKLSTTLTPTGYELHLENAMRIIMDIAGFGSTLLMNPGEINHFETAASLSLQALSKDFMQIHSLLLVISCVDLGSQKGTDILYPFKQMAAMLNSETIPPELANNLKLVVTMPNMLSHLPTPADIRDSLREDILKELEKEKNGYGLDSDITSKIKQLLEIILDPKKNCIIIGDIRNNIARAELLNFFKQDISMLAGDFNFKEYTGHIQNLENFIQKLDEINTEICEEIENKNNKLLILDTKRSSLGNIFEKKIKKHPVPITKKIQDVILELENCLQKIEVLEKEIAGLRSQLSLHSILLTELHPILQVLGISLELREQLSPIIYSANKNSSSSSDDDQSEKKTDNTDNNSNAAPSPNASKQIIIPLSPEEIRAFCTSQNLPSFRTIEEDGNCFFRAVLSALGEDEMQHELLRQEAINYIHQYKAQFIAEYGEEQELHEDAESNRMVSMDEYLAHMSQTGFWVEGIIIRAAALCKGVKIRIIELIKNESNEIILRGLPEVGNEDAPNGAITLLLVNGNHYHATVASPNPQEQPVPHNPGYRNNNLWVAALPSTNFLAPSNNG